MVGRSRVFQSSLGSQDKVDILEVEDPDNQQCTSWSPKAHVTSPVQSDHKVLLLQGDRVSNLLAPVHN